MSKYNDLELPTLMDLLVKHTEEYTKMVTYKVFSVEEFTQCKQKLNQLHEAINAKKGKLSTKSRKEENATFKNSFNLPEQQQQGDRWDHNSYHNS